MPFVSTLAVMAIPFTAPVSTSLTPPVKELISEPTTPDGPPASSATVILSAVSAKTGASLTEVTMIEAVAFEVENAVVPPELAVVA